MKTTLLTVLLISLMHFGFSQSTTINKGSYVIHKNPKVIQHFTSQRIQEIEAQIELRRSETEVVRWDITEYTYVIIQPKNKYLKEIKPNLN